LPGDAKGRNGQCLPVQAKVGAMGVDFLRRAGWLDAARARGYLRVVALLNVAALVLLVATSHGGIDQRL
jgi:hypothetical protein